MADKIEIIEALNAFLEENGALMSYKSQLDDMEYDNGNDFYAFISALCENHEVGEAINYAFTWDHTQEGHQFWSPLSDKWRDLVYDGEIPKKKYNSIW